MKASIFSAALFAAFATTSVVSAQYYNSPAPQSPYRSQPAAVTASRPTPAAATPTFRPINPVQRPGQVPLVANRPTTAPTQVRPVSSSTATQPTLPAYQPSQPWVAPTPSMSYDSGVSGYGMMGGGGPIADGGASYGAPSGGCGCGDGAAYGGSCGGCDSCSVGCGGCGCFCGHTCCIPFKSTGDLVQHMPFFGTTHGYYYFRPYHVMHVFSQQELATRWGGDARNPYDNSMFQRVYEQMGVEAKPIANKTQNVNPVPTTQEYVVPPGQTMTPGMPTPVPMYYGPNSHGYGVPHGTTPTTITPLPQIETVPAR